MVRLLRYEEKGGLQYSCLRHAFSSTPDQNTTLLGLTPLAWTYDDLGIAAGAAATKTLWGRVQYIAQNYDFAEQEGLGANFDNWPNSLYAAFGNNCHVFSGSTIRRVGYSVPDLKWHMRNIGEDPS